jgi:hypothetical protein
MTTLSLTPRIRLVHGGRHLSRVVSNGYGKSEFKTELIAAVEDLKELRYLLEAKYVDRLTKTLQMVSGMKSDAQDH